MQERDWIKAELDLNIYLKARTKSHSIWNILEWYSLSFCFRGTILFLHLFIYYISIVCHHAPQQTDRWLPVKVILGCLPFGKRRQAKWVFISKCLYLKITHKHCTILSKGPIVKEGWRDACWIKKKVGQKL